MKKTLLISILILLGMSQAAAQEYEYVPFVREGVKWVYYYFNPFWEDVFHMDEGLQYYSFEMKGDVEIDGKHYKPVELTHYLNDGTKEVVDYTPICLREENKIVYAIHPDGIEHPQCPVDFFGFIMWDYNGDYINPTSEGEFVLYDFNDPVSLYVNALGNQPDLRNGITFFEYLYTDTIAIGSRQAKCHHYMFQGENRIIESIGYDGSWGMPLFYFMLPLNGMQVTYFFSHVIEDGKIIYKGMRYNPDLFEIPGDVNGDGEINIADANSVIEIVVMGGNPGNTRAPAADANNDGEINIGDINYIINIILNGE